MYVYTHSLKGKKKETSKLQQDIKQLNKIQQISEKD